ncbi:MAG TPA: hypothetical protein VK477_09220 [Acidobacteriota bacterium]|nr:hypothetical protein [Acidobacteriota bacterium]
MKTPRLFASLALVATTAALAADVAPVVAPTKRADTLAVAQKLLTPRDAAAPANLVDPFHSEAFAAAAAASGTATVGAPGAQTDGVAGVARPAGPRSTRDLLQTIGDALRPSGFIVMGGEPSLSFGQKRVKAGGTLTITFEGAEYTLEVTAIDRTNFTLRLNNEEYIRPIKK